MSNNNKAILQGCFDALEAGDVQVLLDKIADNVEWTIIGSSTLSGTYRGKQDLLERLLGRMGERLDGHLTITLDNLLADGDYVVAQGHGKAATKDGRRYDQSHYCWVYRLEDGQIVEVTEYLDPEIVRHAFE